MVSHYLIIRSFRMCGVLFAHLSDVCLDTVDILVLILSIYKDS